MSFSTIFDDLRMPSGPGTVESQLSRLTADDINTVDTTALPRLTPQRQSGIPKQYILEAWTDRSRVRSSAIGRHGHLMLEISAGGMAKALPVWLCKYCDTSGQAFHAFQAGVATSGAKNHLKFKHPTQWATIADDPTSSASSPAPSEGSPAPKRLAVEPGFFTPRTPKAVVTTAQADKVRQTIVDFIVNLNLPFRIVERPEFRALLELFNGPDIDRWIPKTHGKMAELVKDDYDLQVVELTSLLVASPYLKHASFDMWTSPQAYPLMAVVVHFLTADWVLCTRTLGLVYVEGSHSGQNLATHFHHLLTAFDLNLRLGCITTDNASSNDTCIRELLRLRSQGDTAAAPWLQLQRIGCICHILNLSVQAILHMKTKPRRPGDDGDVDDAHDLDDTHDADEFVDSTGDDTVNPVAKLHNFIHWLRRSPQRRQAFHTADQTFRGPASDRDTIEILLNEGQGGASGVSEQSAGLELVADNATRWNSTFNMIVRAIRVEDRIKWFLRLASATEDSTVPERFQLTEHDWTTLRAVATILEPYLWMTKWFEANKARFSDVLPTLYALRSHLQDQLAYYSAPSTTVMVPKPRFTSDDEGIIMDCIVVKVAPPIYLDEDAVQTHHPVVDDIHQAEQQPLQAREARDSLTFIRSAVQAGLEKIDKYIDKMEQMPVYWAAHILHPAYRNDWLLDHMPDRSDLIVAQFKTLFRTHYPPEDPPEQAEPAMHPASRHRRKRRPRGGQLDEVDDYLTMDIPDQLHADGGLAWWSRQAERFPRLRLMAADVLSIPPASTEAERVFSSTNLTVGMLRYRLHAETMGQLQFLRSARQNRAQG